MKNHFRIALSRWWARALFVCSVTLLAGSYVVAAGRVWLAAKWTATSDIKLLRRATRIEPQDEEPWHRLGWYESWNFEQEEIRQAIKDYERAAQLDPGADQIWLDLAAAYETAGDTANARRAYENAKLAHPISGEVAWRYGNYLLRQGSTPDANAQFRLAVQHDLNLAPSVVAECSKSGESADLIFDRALPPDAGAYIAGMDYYLNQNQIEDAVSGWKRLASFGQTVPLQPSFPLINSLIAASRIAEAHNIWQQALRMSGWPATDSKGGSLVFDGGFEHELVNGGFGWRAEPLSGASFEFDLAIAHSGARSLRISLDGSSNGGFQNLVQYVNVRPAQTYSFSAFLRTQDITTDRGFYFAIYDPRDPDQSKSSTPELIGTREWTEVTADFTAGSETELAVIVLRREASRKIDNKIKGVVWVDDVALMQTPPALPTGGR
ncbi:MAG: tetratricopeptide repeat protein [Candidatus Acidiferrales bacterium]